jgi:outer membrane protein
MEPEMKRNQDICCFLRFCFQSILLLSFLLFCLSCRHSPHYDYAAVKSEYGKDKETSGSASPDRTEKSSPSEEKMDAKGELTLERVIRIALQNNPDMDMAVARIQQSEAMLDEATSVFWPVIGIYGEYLQGNAPSAYLFKTIDQRQLPANTDFNDPGWFENYEVGIQWG